MLEMETPPHLVKFAKLWKKYGNDHLDLKEDCVGPIQKRMGIKDGDLRKYKTHVKRNCLMGAQ